MPHVISEFYVYIPSFKSRDLIKPSVQTQLYHENDCDICYSRMMLLQSFFSFFLFISRPFFQNLSVETIMHVLQIQHDSLGHLELH